MRAQCVILILSLLSFVENTSAQAKQTADSAQEFLAIVAREEKLPVYARFAEIHYTNITKTYKERVFNPEWKFKGAHEKPEIVRNKEVAITGLGKVDSCTTKITEGKFSESDRSGIYQPANFKESLYTFEYSRVPPLYEQLKPSVVIPWGKVAITRNAQGVAVAIDDPRFRTVFLEFRTVDVEMQDRIEYAMKFLQMSCDPTASTGF